MEVAEKGRFAHPDVTNDAGEPWRLSRVAVIMCVAFLNDGVR
jgi:hypothetical protein